ncbi:MAG: hypothetical protein HY077_07120 [Elusimicrobia bacterium]|nr:hypothetical protein [Elusimicrobiota bacterium]
MTRLKFAALSMAGWSLFAVFGIRSGHLGLGGWCTDHNSHVDSAILFAYRGFDIYRKPIASLARPSASPKAQEYASRYGWPAEAIYELPDRSKPEPLLINGPTIPHLYPPGALLYAAPEAILKEAFGLAPKTVARLSLLKFLLAAHLLLWLLAEALLRGRDDGSGRNLAFWIILPMAYLETIGWALGGIYDGAAIAAVVLCALALGRRRGLAAVFFYCLAAFLHFRALWFLPLLGRGLWLCWSGGEYRLRGRRAQIAAAVSAAMLGLSAWSFFLIYPALAGMGARNYFYLDADLDSLVRLAYMLVPLAFVGAALARNRAWLLLACLSWTLVMLCRSPFVQMWHSLFLLPLFAMTGLGEKSAARSVVLALLAYLVMASLAFTRFPFSGVLALDVAKELFG